MVKKGPKVTENGKGNPIKSYMTQDKVDLRVEQEAEEKEEAPPPLERSMAGNSIGEEIKQQQLQGMDNSQMPSTKQDMAELMRYLECTIKGELNATRADIKDVLTRVEESEAQIGEHQKVILKLQERADRNWIEMRNLRYKLEDQENRSRRNNLRVRGLPESVENKDLEDVIREIFNKIRKKEVKSPLVFDRIHRVQKSMKAPSESSRDVIVRFSQYKG